MSDPALIDVGVPGWYGKMPNVGDFASRRLPDAFVHRWDRWLQLGLAAARSEYGAAWLAGYLVAPIRRFWLSAGVVGDSAWAGLVMPSVDGVGRHFPLTLAQPAGTLDAALAARDWYRALDVAARRVLDVEFTIDDFERALAQTMPACADDAPKSPDDATRELASRLLSGIPKGGVSVWWCDDPDEQTHFRCFELLPSAEELAAMLVEAT